MTIKRPFKPKHLRADHLMRITKFMKLDGKVMLEAAFSATEYRPYEIWMTTEGDLKISLVNADEYSNSKDEEE